MPESDQGPPSDAIVRFRWLLRAGWLVPSIAVILLALYSIQAIPSKFLSTFSITVMIALASLVAGLLLGFLFGIPRALQQQSDANRASYAVNTNLEQISDWLTKIIVGIGLIQLGRIGAGFSKFTARLGASVGLKPEGQLIAGGEIVFFSVWGFLLGYLLTRTYLTAAFRAFDVTEIAEKAARQAAEAVSQTAEDRQKEQDQADAKALSLASQLLAPGLDSEDRVDPARIEDLEAVLHQASPPILEQVYQLAQGQRTRNWNWKNEADREHSKKLHERTGPVFAALAEVSPDDHRYHGEFGFYLKDKEDPDYSESISQLSRAIDLADQQNFEGAQAWYAVNRAIARIEKGNQLGYSVPWPDQAEIMADLERAQEYGRTPARIAQAEGAIVRWQSQHQRVSR